MRQRPDNQQLLLRYLMGELSEAEQSRLEVSYLADEDLFDELLEAEDELIEGYARNEFSEHERKRIEKHFLRSRIRREKVMLIRTLMQLSGRKPPSPQPQSMKVKRLSWWRDLISFFGNRV